MRSRPGGPPALAGGRPSARLLAAAAYVAAWTTLATFWATQGQFRGW